MKDDIQWYRVGDNKAVVIVSGDNFFTGTSVVIGDNILDRPDGLIIKSEKALQITIPVSALTHEAVLNSRYGPSFPLVRQPQKKCPLTVDNAEIVPLSANSFQVKVWVSGENLEYVKNLPSPVLEINGRFATATIAISVDSSNSWLKDKVILSAAVDAEFVSSTTTAGRLTFPFLGKDWSLPFGTYDIRTSLWAVCSEDGGTTKIRFSGAASSILLTLRRGPSCWTGSMRSETTSRPRARTFWNFGGADKNGAQIRPGISAWALWKQGGNARTPG